MWHIKVDARFCKKWPSQKYKKSFFYSWTLTYLDSYEDEKFWTYSTAGVLFVYVALNSGGKILIAYASNKEAADSLSIVIVILEFNL